VIWNKIDHTAAGAGIERNDCGKISRVRLSARSGEGLDLLRQALAEISLETATILGSDTQHEVATLVDFA
jgi:GTP-binding protein HflX